MEGEAPIMPAWMTARAAVARGSRASLRGTLATKRLAKAAMVAMPPTAQVMEPPRTGRRLAPRMRRRP